MMMTTKQTAPAKNKPGPGLPVGRLAVLLPVIAMALLLTACGSSPAATAIPGTRPVVPSGSAQAVVQPKVARVVTDQGEQVEFNEAPPLNDGTPSFISFVTTG